MDSNIVKNILKEFGIKKQKKEEDIKLLKKQIYSKIPELEKLKDELDKVSICVLKNNMTVDEITRDIQNQNLQIKLNDINNKINKVLKKNGYDETVFIPKYECSLCSDTGYIKNKQCNCLKQAIINSAYEQSNMLQLGEENFDTFDIGYYSSNVDEKLGKSPLENIQGIKKVSEDFCKNILKKEQKSLLFIGSTGLGKTFLSNCIAKEIISKGYTAIYQTAPLLMDTVIGHKLSYNKEESKEKYNQIFDCDLLIIDDLGTETMNNIKFTELFNIINTRLLNNKKMVISTNLTIKKLYEIYDERVVSRFIGNFIICKFIGDDIRLKKKKMS
ncbi:MAG: ATP-binding protein [Clostridia bacterium]